MRALNLYVLAWVLLTIYGGEVCPFLESLGIAGVGQILAVGFGVALLIRPALERRVVLEKNQLTQPRWQLAFDLILFLAVATGLTVYNVAVHHFPMESGLKVVLGSATLGMFSALDLALARERQVAATLDRETITRLPPGMLFSLPRKFLVVTLGAVILVTASLGFLWLAENPTMNLVDARKAVFVELVFVSVVVLGYVVNLVASYALNMRRHFERQTNVLRAVREGDLSRWVPITTRDEFGQIAEYTNTMIEGLKERERVKELFGKVVSPRVAERLLDHEGELLGGQRQKLVILMSDVRGFTSRSEGTDPEQLVRDLNLYFQDMVEQVQRHGGIVDKFIGDGLLAFFGLDQDEDAAERALAAARGMLAQLPHLNERLSSPVEIGIGLHHGEVVAGAIGSQDRLEFTIIGDAVNTASRMEGLTKRLNTPLVLSQAVSEKLGAGARRALVDLGEHQVRGRNEAIHVFGIGPG
jgi:adenylate cyclase